MLQSSKSEKTRSIFLNNLQNEVLGLYSEGISIADIGVTLGMSEHSTSLILHSVVDVMNAKNLVHAFALVQNSLSKTT